MKTNNVTYSFTECFMTVTNVFSANSPPHLQYNIAFLDVAISGCQALRGNVLDKDVAGQA